MSETVLDQRAQLERLRQLKRLRELQAKASGAAVQMASPGSPSAPSPQSVDEVTSAVGADRSGLPDFAQKQSLSDRVVNAAFGNFADEIVAAPVAAIGGGILGTANAIKERDISAIPRTIGEEHKKIRADQAAREAAFERENPGQALAGDILGSTVGIAKAGGLVSRIPGAGQLTAKLPNLAKVAIAGGATGGVFAAGDAAPGERLEEGAKGAAIGAVAGPILQKTLGPVIAKGVTALGSARQAFSGAAKRAAKSLEDVLSFDLGSRMKARQFLTDWMKRGADPTDLLERGGPTLTMLQAEIAARRPTAAVEFVSKIKDEATDEVRGAIARNISPDDRTVRASREALKLARETQAAPFFERARQTPVPDGFVDDLIATRPAVKAAVGKARRELANSQEDTAFEVLKVAKENLDDRVSALLRQGKNAESRRIQIVRDELRGRLTGLSDDYAQGLEIYAGTKAADEALDLGKKFLGSKYTVDDLNADLGRLNPSQREFFKVAVAEEFANVVDNVRDGSNVSRKFASEAFRKKVRTLFANDPENASAFLNAVIKAEDKAIKAGRIDPFAGSPTAPRLRAKESFEKRAGANVEKSVSEATRFDLTRPGSLASPFFRSRAAQKAEEQAERMSDILARAFFEGPSDDLGRAFVPVNLPEVRIPVGATLPAVITPALNQDQTNPNDAR